MKTTLLFVLTILMMIVLVFVGSLSSTYSQVLGIELVSVATDGTQGNRESSLSAISGDGRYIAFQSDSNNLVPNDNNNATDIFVHDRVTGETSRVSVSSNGIEGNANSGTVDISDDGRYIAFNSGATNLVPNTPTDNCTNGGSVFCGGTFVHDRVTGETIMVSVSTNGVPANRSPEGVEISGNGRYVMFHSGADNLVPNDNIICVDLDNRNCPDVFVHDIVTGETTIVSVASNGSHANHLSLIGSLSYDGRYVTFLSHATNLDPRITTNNYNIYVHDQQTGTTTLVSVGYDGSAANDRSYYGPQISGNGRYVAFSSPASNLVPNDTNDCPNSWGAFGTSCMDVFIRDLQTNSTTRIVDDFFGQFDVNAYVSSISDDGNAIVFDAEDGDFFIGDWNDANDVFVYYQDIHSIEMVSVRYNGMDSSTGGWVGKISGDGKWVSFSSTDSLIPDDTNTVCYNYSNSTYTANCRDIYVRDLEYEIPPPLPSEIASSTPTESPTPVPTQTFTRTPNLTRTPTRTPTLTLTRTPTRTPTQTFTRTPTRTPTLIPTNTPTLALETHFISEQMLFYAMQNHLNPDMQLVVVDIKPTQIEMTVEFDDNAIATVILNITLTNELMGIDIASVTFSQGQSSAHEMTIYQDLVPMFMVSLNDLLGSFLSVETIQMTDTGLEITILSQ